MKPVELTIEVTEADGVIDDMKAIEAMNAKLAEAMAQMFEDDYARLLGI